jgi:hypothetical protein
MNGSANYFRHVYILGMHSKSYSVNQLDKEITSINLLGDTFRFKKYWENQ